MEHFVSYRKVCINMSGEMAHWLADLMGDLVGDPDIPFAFEVLVTIQKEMLSPAFVTVNDRITIELSHELAKSLLALMQNDLFDDETHVESNNRVNLFYELKKQVDVGEGLAVPMRGIGEDVPF